MGFAGKPSRSQLARQSSAAQISDQTSRSGQRWVDQDFKDDAALYGRTRSHNFNNGNPIKWLRPHELKDAKASEIELIKDGVGAGDVVQGELGDCYLLGAMSSIAAAAHKGDTGGLLKKLIKSGAAELDKGFVTFQLYSFGEWIDITVDTLVPCDAEGSPLFARCKDPSEMWVIFLEKAYAKLYGSYENLDGGNGSHAPSQDTPARTLLRTRPSCGLEHPGGVGVAHAGGRWCAVTAAIVDLSGGIGEKVDLNDEDVVYEIADGSLWKRLLRYAARDNYMMAAANVDNGQVDRGGKSGNIHRTDLGILVNHAYTLLDAREVGEPYQDKIRLLKLRNPWGMQEWEGPWSDNDQMWNTPIGSKAKDRLGVTFEDDGTFWIAWEDFQAHFNKVYQLV